MYVKEIELLYFMRNFLRKMRKIAYGLQKPIEVILFSFWTEQRKRRNITLTLE